MGMSKGYFGARRCATILSGLLLSVVLALGQRPPLTSHYAVILSDPAILERFPTREAARSVAGENYRRQIEGSQASVKSELASRNIHVVGSVSVSSNSIFVIATPDRVPEMEALPGVKAVIPMRPLHSQMNRAVQAMNAPAAWNLVPGGMQNAGAGIKIAILDSGIDQTHAAFQDSTLTAPSGFPICTQDHPEDCAFTNNKVIVARSYVRMLAAPADPKNPALTSMPDDYSPRDREGHGTAVAAVVAANQNSATTNSGGTFNAAVTFNGMAPKAFLGSYKISGTLGSSNLTFEDVAVQALNDAFNDGMQIANFSSGVYATTGPLDTGATCGLPAGTPCDFIGFNFDKIARAGMVITASAGNDGYNSSQQGYGFPTFNLISSPSNAPSVISVGSTMNSHVMGPGVSVPGGPSNLQNLTTATSDAFPSAPYPPIEDFIVDVSQGGDGYACSTLPNATIPGAIALIQRGPAANPCTFNTKATNAANAGYGGIIFYMADSSTPITVETQDSSGNVPLPGPVVMVSQSAGQALKSYVDANPNAIVLIDSGGTEIDISVYNQLFLFFYPLATNQLAFYSSTGPDSGDLAIKPDLVAVGGGDAGNYASFPDGGLLLGMEGLYTAAQTFDGNGQVYSPTGYLAVEGTSFAAPMVAGAAALMLQLHPNLTPAQVKAILVNSAAQDTTTDDYGDPVDVLEIGAGRLDAGAAASGTIAAQVVTADGSNPVSLSFGALKSGILPIKKQVQVTNLGASAATLSVGVATTVSAAGATVSVDQSSITVAPGASQVVNVTLSGSVPAAGEYNGAITFKNSTVSLRVPYLFLSGSTSGYDMLPIAYGQLVTYNPCIEGLPGGDAGYVGVKLIDASGVPLTGQAVTFSVSPRNSATLASAPIGSVGYAVPTCSGSPTSVTCNTDQYGIAYTEVKMGSAVGGTPGITATSSAATGSMVFEFGGSSQCASEIIPAPSIASVTDPAGGGANIVPGSYLSINGSGLANPAEITASDGYGDYAFWPPLPLSMDGVSVSFDVPGSYNGKWYDYSGQPGYIEFVRGDSGQIVVQVPWELQGQSSVQMKLVVDGFAISNVVTVPLVQFAPALFTNNNIVYAYDVTTSTEVSATSPANAGDVVSLFANGLGPVNNQPASGGYVAAAPNQVTTTTQPTVTIGGQAATVKFSGLDQALADSIFWFQYTVQVTIPPGLTGSQPVVLSIGGLNSTPAPIPIK